LITGCNDRELHVWKISFLEEDSSNKKIKYDANVNIANSDEENEESMVRDMVHILLFVYITFIPLNKRNICNIIFKRFI